MRSCGAPSQCVPVLSPMQRVSRSPLRLVVRLHPSGMHLYSGLLSYRCQTQEDVAIYANMSAGLGPEPTACPVMLRCPDDATGKCIPRTEPFAVSDKEFFGFHVSSFSSLFFHKLPWPRLSMANSPRTPCTESLS